MMVRLDAVVMRDGAEQTEIVRLGGYNIGNPEENAYRLVKKWFEDVEGMHLVNVLYTEIEPNSKFYGVRMLADRVK